MMKEFTPPEVMVKPHMVNTNPDGDDSCPEEDVCFGHSVCILLAHGEVGASVYYSPSSEAVQAWLFERNYQQVSRSGVYPLDGRYTKE